MDLLVPLSSAIVALFTIWISVLASPPDPRIRRKIRWLAVISCALSLVIGLGTYFLDRQSKREQAAAKQEVQQARKEQRESSQRNDEHLAEVSRQLQQIIDYPKNEAQKQQAQGLLARLPRITSLPPLKIPFKDSPLLTPAVRDRTTTDLTKFKNYFVGLDIPTPAEIPPLGVLTGGIGVNVTTTGTSPYHDEIMVGERSLNDRTEATHGYSWYVIKQLVNQKPSKETILSQHTNRAGWALATYYNWSFWNNAPKKQPDQWAATLWKIREKFGQKFTDQMLAYTLRSIHDSPEEGADANFNIYFFRKLRTGELAVDNEHRKLSEINEILKRARLVNDPNIP